MIDLFISSAPLLILLANCCIHRIRRARWYWELDEIDRLN